MDAIDRKILALLQADGRQTLTELADRVSLSVSRCQRRLRDLERDGVIRGYHAAVDAVALGLGFEVLAFVSLLQAGPDTLADFDAAVSAVPNVVQAQRLFGDPDYLLRIVAADLAAYQGLYDTTLVRLPGVQRINSTIVMKQVVKSSPAADHVMTSQEVPHARRRDPVRRVRWEARDPGTYRASNRSSSIACDRAGSTSAGK
ncbi:Lrp/AsnC family transcriptional regulator [Actinoplanes sp. NPDC051851]|uniref:Lrp/AsnC family transcriptional regulator n=1 Tax=Actinoplanes sp. NPDC051851 TaxID=3154753 RepID=UPI00342EEBF9